MLDRARDSRDLNAVDTADPAKRGIERAKPRFRDSGIGFAFVQPSGFMDNFLNWAGTIKADGVARCAAGSGAIPFIHSDDIADVVVAAMTRPQYVGQSLPIIGPEALSFADMTAKVGAVIGRRLRFDSRRDRQCRRSAWPRSDFV